MPHPFSDYTPPTINEIFTPKFKLDIIEEKLDKFTKGVMNYMFADGFNELNKGKTVDFEYDVGSSLKAGLIEDVETMRYFLELAVEDELDRVEKDRSDEIPEGIDCPEVYGNKDEQYPTLVTIEIVQE